MGLDESWVTLRKNNKKEDKLSSYNNRGSTNRNARVA